MMAREGLGINFYKEIITHIFKLLSFSFHRFLSKDFLLSSSFKFRLETMNRDSIRSHNLTIVEIFDLLIITAYTPYILILVVNFI